MISLQDTVDDLYRITVVEKKHQSPDRLAMLAELDRRGIVGAAKELSVPGIGRTKAWDVGWPSDGKVRLGISLKSLLRNVAGTVPNRVDDLQGEMACGKTGRDGLIFSATRPTSYPVKTLPRGRQAWLRHHLHGSSW